MNEQRIDFIEELLQESEKQDDARRLEMNRVSADQILAAVSVIDREMEEVSTTCRKEIELIKGWEVREMDRLDRKRAWLLMNLEMYLKDSGLRSLRCPHGEARFRKLRDRIQVTSLEEFLVQGMKLGLVRSKEAHSPDLQAILEWTRRTGEILPGTKYLQGGDKFYYSTNGKEGNDEQSEQRGGGESAEAA
jgi:hypothetical protein